MAYGALSSLLISSLLIPPHSARQLQKPMPNGYFYFWLTSEWDCPDEKSKQIQQPHIPWGLRYRAHLTIPRGFSLKKSTVEGAGLGIFADTFIAKYTWLAEYEGTPLPMCDPPAPPEVCQGFPSGCDYAFTVHRGGKAISTVDAVDPTVSNWLRWINCSRMKREENVTPRECLGKVYFQVQKDIAPGSELFVFYGEDFASELGINLHQYGTED